MQSFTVNNLSLVRDGKTIFSNINFSLSNENSLIIKGNNGSGKTSLLKTIVGIMKPTSGDIFVNNDRISNYSNIHKQSVYIGHKNYCDSNLTVLENLEQWANMRDTIPLLLPTIAMFQLGEILDLYYYKLSQGWKRRVALSRILLSDAILWILDEPFSNIDDEGYQTIESIIKTRLEQKGIVIITTNKKNFLFDTPKTSIINI